MRKNTRDHVPEAINYQKRHQGFRGAGGGSSITCHWMLGERFPDSKKSSMAFIACESGAVSSRFMGVDS
jgi:hypothetical protein